MTTRMRLRLSGRADADLNRVYRESIAQFGRAQANRYYDGILAVFRHLLTFPLSVNSHPTYRGKVRIWTIESHRIVYRVVKDEVVIVRIVHAHRNLDDLFG
jgi:toxin ParE1/3/4